MFLYIYSVHFAGSKFKMNLCILSRQRKTFGQVLWLQQFVFITKEVRNRTQEKLGNPECRNLPGKVCLNRVLCQHISKFTSHKSIVRCANGSSIALSLLRCLAYHCGNSSFCRCAIFQCCPHFLDIDIIKCILSRLWFQRNFHLYNFRLCRYLGDFNRFTDPIVLTAEACLIQTNYNFLQCAVEIHGIGQHIRCVQQRRGVLCGIGLAQNTAKDLLYIHCRSAVG